MGDTSRSWRSWRRSGRLKEEDEGAARLTRKRDLILAFAIVSLPLLVIAIILLAFVFAPSHHVILDPSVGSVELPASNDVPTGSYFTTISPGKFLLLGSWASNVAELVVAPFMLLFSYAVAREILLQQPSVHSNKTTDANPSLLRELMTGAHGMQLTRLSSACSLSDLVTNYVYTVAGIWHWSSLRTWKKKTQPRSRPWSMHVVDIAAFGLLTASLLTWVKSYCFCTSCVLTGRLSRLMIIVGGTLAWLGYSPRLPRVLIRFRQLAAYNDTFQFFDQI